MLAGDDGVESGTARVGGYRTRLQFLRQEHSQTKVLLSEPICPAVLNQNLARVLFRPIQSSRRF